MANTNIFNKTFSLNDPKVLVAGVVMFGMALFGVYKLATSHAASNTPDLEIVMGVHAAREHDASIRTVTDNTRYLGDQTVVELLPGKQASFYPTEAGAGADFVDQTWTCFLLKSIGSPSNVTLTSGSHTVTIGLAVSPHYYQNRCITFTAGSMPGYDVRNNSGGKVRIYQVSYHFNNSNPAVW